MCRVYLHQVSMRKSNQKIGKTQFPSFLKSYSTSRKERHWRKKEKISKSKTTTLAFSYNLKKKQQNEDGKKWCYTESFMLQISGLLHSVLEILNF